MRAKSNISLMGVINITPDSFSDGNQYTSLDKFSEQFEKVLSWADVIDIGAESTAPKNTSISTSKELSRYKEVFIPYIENHDDPETIISLDTYKIDVFEEIATFLTRYWPKTKIIFNDVSGKLDKELIEFLSDSKLDFSYVFSHNLAPSRKQTNKHMDYCFEGKILSSLIDYFKSGLEELKPTNREVLVDPCFGFSKTRGQNQEILNDLAKFTSQLPQGQKIVYGISRKSFLRFPVDLDIKTEQGLRSVDIIHGLYLNQLLELDLKNHTLLRVHDPIAFNAVMNFNAIGI